MDEQLTEKNLEFLEHYFDPTSLTENLVPENFNSPQMWDEFEECVLQDSNILMEDYTSKKIQDIVINDYILTFDEKNRFLTKSKVLKKVFKGYKQVVKLTTKSGLELECTLDHKICAKSDSSSQWLWLNAENLLNRNVVRLPFSIKNLDDYYEGQLLGWIDSDGTLVKNKESIIKSIKIYQKTELEAVIWLLKKLKISYHQHEDRPNFYSFKLNIDNPQFFIDYLFRKFYSCKDFQLGYLCGFLLGDGHYDTHNRHWVIKQKKIKQVERLNWLFKKFNLKRYAYKPKSSMCYYYIPKYILPFYNLKSLKIKKFWEHIKNKRTVLCDLNIDKVIKLELLDKKPVWDLTTEVHTFIANNILVHNCIYLRPYQFSMQNYSYMYANDPELTPKENFRIKKGAGDGYHIAARNVGKSMWLIIDVVLSIIHNVREGMVASDCAEHLKKVTEPIANFVESHKFLKIFHLKDSRANTVKRDYLTITTETGTIIRHVNEKADTDTAGTQYHGKHADVRFYEEESYASAKGESKAVDSVGKFGRIERLSGIPDVSLGSPLGKILRNKNLKNWIWRLPQLVKESWDEQTEQEKAELYNGIFSASYKLNVLAEEIEGAFGFFDMERLRETSVDKGRYVKNFEVSKEQFNGFEDRLIVERLPGSEQVFICADIGFGSAPTEIIILFFDGKKYKYVYNITVYRLLQKEQAKIFKFLYDKLGGAFIAIDATSDEGATIDELYSLGIPQEHLLKVKFNENIEVGFEKDKEDKTIIDGEGNPVMKKMKTELFSFQELERLMYDGRMEIWFDEKFINQFTDIIAKQSGLRLNFDSKGVNHLVQSIPKDEVILCQVKGKIVTDRIDNIEKITNQVKVPTYNEGKLIWKKGTIIKELNQGNKIFHFKFKPNKSLKVTEGHSMLIWNSQEQKLEEKLAKDVKIGDLALSAQNLHYKEPQNYLEDEIFYVYGKGNGRKKSQPKKIIIDEKLAYFLGWCCAEGSKSGDGGYSLALNTDDPYEKLAKLINGLFGAYPRIYKNGKHQINLAMRGGIGLTNFIEKHINRLSHFKRIPAIILNSKKSVRDSFMKGLIEGDGNKEGRLTTTSRSVANGFFTVNSLANKHTSLTYFKNKYENYEYYLMNAKRNGYFENIPYKALQYDYSENTNKKINRNKIKNANYTWSPKSKINKEILKKVKDFEFVEVVKIDTYDYDDYIYDLEVADTHNFLAGVGNIVVHNSFQVFAICRFFNEFNILKNSQTSNQRGFCS